MHGKTTIKIVICNLLKNMNKSVVGECVCETGDYIILGRIMTYGKYTLETCAVF
jgi:hypothetical protein